LFRNGKLEANGGGSPQYKWRKTCKFILVVNRRI